MNRIKQAFKDRLWLGVIIVGLFAGLIGGGIALGINNLVQHHEEVTSTRVPAGSNKSGGTKVNKNKADLNGEASQAYKSVQGAVVSVINKQKVQQSSGTLGIFGYGNSSNGSSSDSSSDNKLETASEGSGVIYKKSGNSAYVVTNNHVVKGSNALQVILSNGKKVNADLVGADSATDLAVLKINATNVKTVASFGNSNSIVPGQDCVIHIHCSVFKDQLCFSAAKIILSNLRFSVKFHSDTVRSFRFTGAVEWCLWNAVDDSTNFQRNLNIGELEVEGSVIYHKTEYRERRDHYAYYGVNAPLSGYDTDRDSFLGTFGSFAAPQAVVSGKAGDFLAHGGAPMAGLHLDVTLAPGESKSFVFVLGYGKNPRDQKFIAPGVIRKDTDRKSVV